MLKLQLFFNRGLSKPIEAITGLSTVVFFIFETRILNKSVEKLYQLLII